MRVHTCSFVSSGNHYLLPSDDRCQTALFASLLFGRKRTESPHRHLLGQHFVYSAVLLLSRAGRCPERSEGRLRRFVLAWPVGHLSGSLGLADSHCQSRDRSEEIERVHSALGSGRATCQVEISHDANGFDHLFLQYNLPTARPCPHDLRPNQRQSLWTFEGVVFCLLAFPLELITDRQSFD